MAMRSEMLTSCANANFNWSLFRCKHSFLEPNYVNLLFGS